MYNKFINILALVILSVFVGELVSQTPQFWQPVGNSRQVNISGMALIETNPQQITFLAVHDNKKKKEKRAGTITVSTGKLPLYTPLEWLGSELPVDLEAISAISDKPNNFMALTSAGKIYHIELNRSNNSVNVIKSFETPSISSGSNFEGFALQKIGDVNLIVWAERGDNSKPGTVFWSKFDLGTYTFAQTQSASIKVPYPNSNVRHISDIRLDASGKLFISSAADPGNNGPFASAVYLAGTFDVSDSAIPLNQSPLSQIFLADNRKIEAFEILQGEKNKMVFGTDDENLGSAIYVE